MIIVFGPVSNIFDLMPLVYFPDDLPKPTSKDHLLMFVKSSLFDDSRAVPILESFPFRTVIIEADNKLVSCNLSEYPDSRAYGCKAKKISERICCLTNCGIYKIGGKRILILPFGQAVNNAADKGLYRRHYAMRVSCRKLLEKEDKKVDAVISQIIPFSVAKKTRMKGRYDYNTLMVERINETYDFQRWYFTGFYHDDPIMKKYENVSRMIHIIE